MAQVPRALVDALTRSLGALSADMRGRLAAALATVDFSAPVAEVREACVAAMELYCGPYSDMAAELAAEFYDAARELAAGGRLGALAESGREPAATEGAVRAIMRDVAEGRPAEGAARKLLDRADYEVKRAAGECVYRNGERDPLDVRYARVPGGADTCPFCLMLASRGFVYRSGAAAGAGGHYHPNCDCRIVPGFDGAESGVEGYDPDALYRQWKRLDEAEVIHAGLYEGGKVSVEREAERLHGLQKESWLKHKAAGASALSYREHYAGFVKSLPGGDNIDIEDFTLLEGKEVQLGSWLAAAGDTVVFRNPDAHKGADGNTSDILLNGELFDIKRVTSSKRKKLVARVTEKLPRQGPNFIVDLSTSEIDGDTAAATIAWLLEDPRIEKILLVRSGSAKLFKK